jgi:tRNA-splicing ligase RtcB
VEVVSCHHNYVTWEHHYGENVLITRKGAVRAREGDMGIIPGSMGARSYIVRGKGNPESFMSCSHGAGRAMSRTEAKRRFTLDAAATSLIPGSNRSWVSGSRMTGMRSWTAEVTAFGAVVRIEQVSTALPLGFPQQSQTAANSVPSLTSKQYGCFAFPVRTHL